jgi:hypothetical protein
MNLFCLLGIHKYTKWHSGLILSWRQDSVKDVTASRGEEGHDLSES